MCDFFLEKFTLCFREMLVDFRGRTACRIGHAPMQFSHTHMEAGVCAPCSLTAQGWWDLDGDYSNDLIFSS